MIDRYDLYDMSFALAMIRYDIRSRSNIPVLARMIGVLEAKEAVGDNQIRRALSSIAGLDRERWLFVYHNNVYVNCRILKRKSVYDLLIKSFRELERALHGGEFDRADALADALHCLPEMIADNDFRVPKTFWKVHIKIYRDKWDGDFLRAEQKAEKTEKERRWLTWKNR